MPKNRGCNYSEEEKQILLIIIDKNKKNILNKKFDSNSTKVKQYYWNIIAQEYNSLVDRPRETKHLKECYYNINKRISRVGTIMTDFQENEKNIQSYTEWEQKELNIPDANEFLFETNEPIDKESLENNISLSELTPEMPNEVTNKNSEYTSAMNKRRKKIKNKLLKSIIEMQNKKNCDCNINNKKELIDLEIQHRQEINKRKLKILDIEVQQKLEEYEVKKKLWNLEIKIKQAELQSKLKLL